MSALLAPPATRSSSCRQWSALAVLMLPVLLISVDNTVLSFALPAITTALGATGGQLLWIVDAYPLMLAGLLVPMGSLGDRIGRRRLLLIGATGFALVSLLAAWAPTPELLIAARALLGVFGATLMPSTLSLLRNVFTDRAQRRLAIAIWAAGFAAGGALGPIVGGFLLTHFWWGSVFLLNTPLLLVLIPLALWLVPESRDPNPGRVDVPSIALSLVTMLPLVHAIIEVGERGVTVRTLLGVAIGLTAGTLFVRRQLRLATPMLDVTLFTRASFSGAVSANLLSIMGFSGLLVVVSQFLQLVLGMSPMDAGLVLLPGLVASVVAGLLAVKLVKRIRPATLIGGSFLLAALGYLLASRVGTDPTAGTIAVAFVVMALGVGLAETLTNDEIVSSVPAEKAGAASAVSETAYELGTTLGVAVLGSVLNATYRAQVVVPAAVTGDQAHAAAETLAGAVRVAGEIDAGVADSLLSSARAAFDLGMQRSALLGIVVAVAAAVVSFVTLRKATGD
ncbi:MFS transporter [Cellulomonas denverensis]|uniref:MFS transporter n=1 Tax=Cellulomonas denverensis TaxID=264297 RepID=A0A7X6KWH8_9CELL|nr:MFS transporter [Cellulomonas denverensis]NKY23430.1 MFS transporter [Cellulomonas denverensis]GIG25088.1 MFS transporter [Cellulomonas denverensis]